MSLRARVGRGLEATLGRERTQSIRSAERRYRRRLADRIAPPERTPRRRGGAGARRRARPAPSAPPAPAPASAAASGSAATRVAPAPEVPHPTPTMGRHDLLRRLHELLTPRTYLEIGVRDGSSLTLSRARSVAVDPAFVLSKPVRCDLDLVRAESDAFFAAPDALAHLDGVPVDLAFIDGMHLSEFALRDFINVERHLARTGVAVLDDVLPRNALEASRVRRTGPWAGDTYKAVEVVARHRPDLVVLLVNTSPTGTAVIVGADPGSTVLQDRYDDETAYLEAEDPQDPPQEYMTRAVAVDPVALLASEAWSMLVAARESDDRELRDRALEVLRSVPTLG